MKTELNQHEQKELQKAIRKFLKSRKFESNNHPKMNEFEIIYKKRTTIDKIKDSYSMFRVCISRMMRGDKPRFKHFLFK